jgi:dihydroorotate dehydrogenase (NAD+) catalytic subunit
VLRQDLFLASPWMNAAGMLGYAPTARMPLTEPLGAFVTNPISVSARTPAAERSMLAYSGGMLLHSGLPNPGLRSVLKDHAARWAQSSLPVWVHLFGSSPEEIAQMVRRLEGVEGVMAIELGLPPDAEAAVVREYVEASYGELPLIVHIPLTAARETWLAELPRLGVSAISLGAPRGTLPNETGRPVSGRLYGPSLLPLCLAAVQCARKHGLPIIAGAGIYRRQDVQALRDAGAWAVQLDTVLWRGWAEDETA